MQWKREAIESKGTMKGKKESGSEKYSPTTKLCFGKKGSSQMELLCLHFIVKQCHPKVDYQGQISEIIQSSRAKERTSERVKEGKNLLRASVGLKLVSGERRDTP